MDKWCDSYQVYISISVIYQNAHLQIEDIQNLKWSMQMVIHERSLRRSHD